MLDLVTLGSIITFFIGVIGSALSTFVYNKKKVTATSILTFGKEELYKLFLLAEKQEWVGPEKMKFVTDQLASRMPADLLKLVPQETLEAWAADEYIDFKMWLNNNTLNLDSHPSQITGTTAASQEVPATPEQ